MLAQEKVKATKHLEDELASVRAEPVEETIVEHDPLMRAVRIFTSTTNRVALIKNNGKLLEVSEVWLPDWLFRETRLRLEPI